MKSFHFQNCIKLNLKMLLARYMEKAYLKQTWQKLHIDNIGEKCPSSALKLLSRRNCTTSRGDGLKYCNIFRQIYFNYFFTSGNNIRWIIVFSQMYCIYTFYVGFNQITFFSIVGRVSSCHEDTDFQLLCFLLVQIFDSRLTQVEKMDA